MDKIRKGDEVIVTTRKREENLQSVPIAVDAITAEDIERIEAGILIMGDAKAPERSPSEWQCGRCDIHVADCPKRWQESQRLTAATSRF